MQIMAKARAPFLFEPHRAGISVTSQHSSCLRRASPPYNLLPLTCAEIEMHLPRRRAVEDQMHSLRAAIYYIHRRGPHGTCLVVAKNGGPHHRGMATLSLPYDLSITSSSTMTIPRYIRLRYRVVAEVSKLIEKEYPKMRKESIFTANLVWGNHFDHHRPPASGGTALGCMNVESLLELIFYQLLDC